MRLRIWGCRGSLATPGPATLRYGGNTSCVELRGEDGSLLVFDAGTGIRQLGQALSPSRPKTIHLLLTHLHLDHIEGLGFFAALHDPECEIHLYGPAAAGRSLRDRIAGYLSPPYYPLVFDTLAARFSFHEVERDAWEIGGLRVRSAPVTHPGATVGYRIEENGRSFAFVPDNEPALNGPLDEQPDGTLSGLARRAAVPICSSTTRSTRPRSTRRGWGGGIRASRISSRSCCAPTRPGFSCSTTTPRTPTATSRRCMRTPGSSPAPRASASRSHTKGSSSSSREPGERSVAVSARAR